MRITMEDLARMAGVSKSTVSRVLNNNPNGVGEETRKRVQALIDELDYKPNLLARGIATSKSKTIGLIVSDITNPFFALLVKYVEEVANQNGYVVIFGNTDSSVEKEQNYVSTFIAKRVDGIIFTSTVAKPLSLIEKLKKYNVPYVFLDRSVQQMGQGVGIFVDIEYAIFISCSYLINHGNKNIAYILGPPSSTTHERVNGYIAALTQYGRLFDTNLISYGDYTFESGYKAVYKFHHENINFDAILAADDILAMGAIKALKELKYSIPSDVEIIGFDNIDFAEMFDPPLTTIQQPTYELAKEATKLLLMMINGKKPENVCLCLQPKLIIRSTTRPDSK